jgi:hypothetical protein
MARTPRSIRTARDNARARALGYDSYYDLRVHDYGRLSPDQPRARGELLRRLRGHASGSDLKRDAAEGDLVVGSMGRRDAKGHYRQVDVTIIHADGGEGEYRLQGSQLDRDYLLDLVEELEADGVIFSPAPSLDLRRMANTATELELFRFARGAPRRFLRRLSKIGAALTTANPERALLVEGIETAQRFYDANLGHLKGKRRFTIEEAD